MPLDEEYSTYIIKKEMERKEKKKQAFWLMEKKRLTQFILCLVQGFEEEWRYFLQAEKTENGNVGNS